MDGDLAISVRRQNGNKVSVSLTNRYPDYKSDPANFAAIVDLIVGSLSEKRRASREADRMRIVPVIKDREWLDEVRQSIKTSGKAQDVLFEEFNKELVMVFAEDTEKRMRYLLSTDDIGVERKELRKLAVDNLARILPKIEMQGDDVLAMSRRAAITRQACSSSTASGMAGRSRWREISLWRCPPRMCCWSPARRTAKVSPPYARWLRSS